MTTDRPAGLTDAATASSPNAPQRSRLRAAASDLIIGGLAVAIGLAVILYSQGMPEIRPGIPGPGLFPTMIGGFLVLFGASQVVLALLGRTARPEEPVVVPEDDEPITAETIGTTAGALATSTRSAVINSLGFIVAIVFYIVAAKALGFVPTMLIITIGLMLMLRVKWWLAVVIGVATTLSLWALFEKLLLVQLPNGFLDIF